MVRVADSNYSLWMIGCPSILFKLLSDDFVMHSRKMFTAWDTTRVCPKFSDPCFSAIIHGSHAQHHYFTAILIVVCWQQLTSARTTRGSFFRVVPRTYECMRFSPCFEQAKLAWCGRQSFSISGAVFFVFRQSVSVSTSRRVPSFCSNQFHKRS